MDQGMITAIVVDDELNTRKLLQSLLDWESLGIVFRGEAANGNEALDLIETEKPEVVFTDINMPYMDGLELARRIKERDPFVKVVILTAYPEFEYAKRSVKIGVYDFLLKPVQPGVLKKLAMELKEKIDQETAHWNEYRKIKTELLENARELQEKFLMDLLADGKGPDDLDRRFESLFAKSPPLDCAVAVLDVQAEQETEKSLGAGLGGLRVVEFLIQEREAVHAVRDHAGRVAIVCWGGVRELEWIGEQAIRAVKQKLDGHATVGIGSAYRSLARVQDSYREALEALRYGELFGGGQVILFEEDLRVADREFDGADHEIDEIVFYVKAGTKEQAMRAVDRLFHSLAATRGATIEQAYSLGVHLVSSLVLALSELGMLQLRAKLLDGALYARMFGCRSAVELGQLMSGLAEEAADAVNGTRTRKTNRIAGEVISYLSAAFTRSDTTLSSVADHFHLNASYLSRIFKEETGQSFTDYLLKLRMDEALKLLNGTDLKAYQIAEKVGIADPYYFSHRFKKTFGVSVQAYKRGSQG